MGATEDSVTICKIPSLVLPSLSIALLSTTAAFLGSWPHQPSTHPPPKCTHLSLQNREMDGCVDVGFGMELKISEFMSSDDC